MVSSSPVRIERRTVRKPRKPQPQNPQPPRAFSMGPPQPATLSLPSAWAKQDFGYLATTQTTMWLDWTKQSARWVPRVFLWAIKVEPGYMRRPSLQGTVHGILASLRDEEAKVYASKAQRVCGGQQLGWFLSYVKPSDDPPVHIDETLFMSGGMLYRATYIRAADSPEDAKTREALNTLCS